MSSFSKAMNQTLGVEYVGEREREREATRESVGAVSSVRSTTEYIGLTRRHIQKMGGGGGTSTNTGSGSDPPEIQTDPDPSLDIKKTWTPPLKNNPDLNLNSKKFSF